MSCAYHKEMKASLNASQIAYQIHKQSLSFSTTSFHTPLPSQPKLNVLTGAAGLGTHRHTTTLSSSTARVIQQYSCTLRPHCAHTEASFPPFVTFLFDHVDSQRNPTSSRVYAILSSLPQACPGLIGILCSSASHICIVSIYARTH